MITLCIASLTGVLVCLSVIFKPVIRIGHFNIGTYWIISLLGAIFLLIFHQLPIKYLWNRIIEPTPVNPIKILILFLGMTFLSIVLDELGFFQFLANLILKENPKIKLDYLLNSIFWYLYLQYSLLMILSYLLLHLLYAALQKKRKSALCHIYLVSFLQRIHGVCVY